MRKQKLELDWIGKDEHLFIEPRILISSNEKERWGLKDNLLINGDNLLALKALEESYANLIQCIYIDPPYNSGNAFRHYDDSLEHSKWLSLMKPRIELLRRLLAPTGYLFVSIDDDEMAYLKVLMDEAFGRNNYCGTLVWEKKKKPSFLSKLGSITEYILVYAKNKLLAPDLLYGETTANKKYPLNNAGNGLRTLTFPPNSVQFSIPDGKISAQDMSAGNIITKLENDLIIKNGTNSNTFQLAGEWRYSQSKIDEIIKNKEPLVISKIPFRPNHIKAGGEPKKMKNLLSISHYEIATYEDATEESRKIFGDEAAFDYPKPEKLISILVQAATKPGDIVLDSFLGSGTTAAVAHKLGRKWIGIEQGEHFETHCIKRLSKVVSGEDQIGISGEVNWKGGGEFKILRLAPTLLLKDEHGGWIISPKYNAIQLSEAVCKHEGFKFWPDQNTYWKQGKSTEKDFIFVTTEFLTSDRIERIADSMRPDETLLVCAKAFRVPADKYANITIKKIPQMLLGRCEFGRDDYSLNVSQRAQEELGLDEADN